MLKTKKPRYYLFTSGSWTIGLNSISHNSIIWPSPISKQLNLFNICPKVISFLEWIRLQQRSLFSLPLVHDLNAGVDQTEGPRPADAGRAVYDAGLIFRGWMFGRNFLQQSEEGRRLGRHAEVRPLVVVVLSDGASRLAGIVVKFDLSDHDFLRVLQKI